MNPEYLKLYDSSAYFLGNYGTYEQKCWDKNQLRYGDQLPAICYAFGLDSFEEVRDLYEFNDIGKSGEPFIGAVEQLLMLMNFEIDRYPKSVVDIGGGRGEIAVAFSFWKDIKVQLIEPSSCASALLEMTREKFSIWENVKLWNKELKIARKLVDWDGVDTVIMTESIEHIEQEDFDGTFKYYIKPTLQKNRGLLIITNWIDFHPIEPLLPFHCRRIDDSFYDSLVLGGKIIFRQGSHIVIQY